MPDLIFRDQCSPWSGGIEAHLQMPPGKRGADHSCDQCMSPCLQKACILCACRQPKPASPRKVYDATRKNPHPSMDEGGRVAENGVSPLERADSRFAALRGQHDVVHSNLHLVSVCGSVGRPRINQHGVVLEIKPTADSRLNLRSQRHNVETHRRGRPWSVSLRNPASGQETPSASMPAP